MQKNKYTRHYFYKGVFNEKSFMSHLNKLAHLALHGSNKRIRKKNWNRLYDACWAVGLFPYRIPNTIIQPTLWNGLEKPYHIHAQIIITKQRTWHESSIRQWLKNNCRGIFWEPCAGLQCLTPDTKSYYPNGCAPAGIIR